MAKSYQVRQILALPGSVLEAGCHPTTQTLATVMKQLFTFFPSVYRSALLLSVAVAAAVTACDGAKESSDLDSGGGSSVGGAFGGMGGNGEDPSGGRNHTGGSDFGDAPLYGEKGTPPESLQLRFQHINIPQTDGGTDLAFLPSGREILFSLRSNFLLHVGFEDGVASFKNKWQLGEEAITAGACGPSNILLDYEYEETHFIYTSYCVNDRVTRLMRYTFSPEEGPQDPAVIFETELAEGQALDEWHRIGSMGWEDNGVLWFLSGDHFHDEWAQVFENPMGSVQRILPNRQVGGEGHEIPEGNMEISMGGAGQGESVDPGLFAYGFRSPWRGTRDSLGRYWIGDVGLVDIEEVNLVTEVGQNFGWNVHEGPCLSDCEGYQDPLVSYDRSEDHPYIEQDPETVDSSQRAIWVGEIYENPRHDRYAGMMDGMVPYGDLFTGWVRGLRADDEGTVTMDRSIGNLPYVTAWEISPDGYAYALDLGGQLHVALLDFQSEN